MDDCIKRSDALNRFKEIKESGVSLKDSVYLDGVMAVIENLPAADVAPVVSCREYALCSEDASTGKLWCTKPMGCIGCLEVKPDDFCSFGERKKAQDE